MTSVQAGLVTRSPQRLAANPSRVITRLFVPGQEGFEYQESRAGAVLARILALDEGQVRSSLEDVVIRFNESHSRTAFSIWSGLAADRRAASSSCARSRKRLTSPCPARRSFSFSPFVR